MLETVPWFVGGGAQHSPEVARVLAYAATSGSRGIIGPGDLQVRALSVPGASVRIAPGVGVMPNTYPGAILQTYIGRNASETTLSVPATGSSGGAAYLVIMKVKDPQYPGTPIPPNPATADYLDFQLIACSATAKTMTFTYPYVILARLNIPANTATITQAMVTDLREMAMPRRKRDLSTIAVTAAGTEVLDSTAPDGETWPNAATDAWGAMEIPEWATQARVVCTWGGVLAPAGNAYGTLWVQLGTDGDANKRVTQTVGYDTPNAAGNSRFTMTLGDVVSIPTAFRGTNQPFRPKGRFAGGSTASRVMIDAGSAVVMDWEFLESPTQDDF